MSFCPVWLCGGKFLTLISFRFLCLFVIFSFWLIFGICRLEFFGPNFWIFVFCWFVKTEVVFASLLLAVCCVILLLFTGVRRGSERGVVGVVGECVCLVCLAGWVWLDRGVQRTGGRRNCVPDVCGVVVGFVGRERDVCQCACEQGVLRGWRSRYCLGGSAVWVWSVRGQVVCRCVLVGVSSLLFVFVVWLALELEWDVCRH